jgi:hypothetical protein
LPIARVSVTVHADASRRASSTESSTAWLSLVFKGA